MTLSSRLGGRGAPLREEQGVYGDSTDDFDPDPDSDPDLEPTIMGRSCTLDRVGAGR